jgi:hypothetical protein
MNKLFEYLDEDCDGLLTFDDWLKVPEVIKDSLNFGI